MLGLADKTRGHCARISVSAARAVIGDENLARFDQQVQAKRLGREFAKRAGISREGGVGIAQSVELHLGDGIGQGHAGARTERDAFGGKRPIARDGLSGRGFLQGRQLALQRGDRQSIGIFGRSRPVRARHRGRCRVLRQNRRRVEKSQRKRGQAERRCQQEAAGDGRVKHDRKSRKRAILWGNGDNKSAGEFNLVRYASSFCA